MQQEQGHCTSVSVLLIDRLDPMNGCVDVLPTTIIYTLIPTTHTFKATATATKRDKSIVDRAHILSPFLSEKTEKLYMLSVMDDSVKFIKQQQSCAKPS
jgi:hypothetical protein